MTEKHKLRLIPDSARQMVEKWFVDFKRARTNADDAEGFGGPKYMMTSENTNKVFKIDFSSDVLFSPNFFYFM